MRMCSERYGTIKVCPSAGRPSAPSAASMQLCVICLFVNLHVIVGRVIHTLTVLDLFYKQLAACNLYHCKNGCSYFDRQVW